MMVHVNKPQVVVLDAGICEHASGICVGCWYRCLCCMLVYVLTQTVCLMTGPLFLPSLFSSFSSLSSF